MRASVFLTMVALGSLATSVLAGPNADGTLILHANPEVVYTSDTTNYCGQSGLLSCDLAVTMVPADPEVTTVFYAMAAFPEGSSPRLSVVSFGVEYDAEKLVLLKSGHCADLELVTTAWPASGSGTSLNWNVVETTELVELYWFAGYAYGDTTSLSLAPHPLQGGQFADDAIPAALDSIAGYGRIGFGTGGGHSCPMGDGPSGPDWPESPESATAVALNDSTGLYVTAAASERIPCWWIADIVLPQVLQNCEYGTIHADSLRPNPGLGVIYFFSRTSEPPWDPILNLPMALDSKTDSTSGYHNHTNPPRQEADPPHLEGNSGEDGFQFRVTHHWWEDARDVNLFVYSTDPEREYGSRTSPAFKYCVRQGTYGELPDRPDLYEKIGLASNRHFREHHYGSQALVNAITELSTGFEGLSPDTLLGINDMSLPYGGLFDHDAAQPWDDPHCGHRWGVHADIQYRWRHSPQQKSYIRNLLEKNIFGGYFLKPFYETKAGDTTHVHVTVKRAQQAPQLASLVGDDVLAPPLRVDVTGIATQDPETGWWRYSYTVSNRENSGGVVELFSITPAVFPPIEIEVPEHWKSFYGFDVDATGMVWSSWEMGPPPPGWNDNGVDLYPSAYAIPQGEELTGFSFLSPCEPDVVNYLASFWRPMPGMDEDTEDPPAFWEGAATGTVVGPSTAVPAAVGNPSPHDQVGFLVTPVPGEADRGIVLSFSLSTEGFAELDIFDSSGRSVAEVMRETLPTGRHAVTWKGASESGVYFARLKVDGRERGSRKLLVLQ